MKKLIYLEDAIDAVLKRLCVKSEEYLTPSERCVIDALKDLQSAEPEKDWTEITVICDNCGHAVHAKREDCRVSAEPEQRWIPVTERLPEPNTRCLVTTEDGYIDIDDYYIYGWDDNCDTVIAWMPMPTSYKEDSKCQK